MAIIMDTHIHSKASDGLWTPTEVVKQAKSKGLEVIALTDHDTTFGIPEAQKAAEESSLRLVHGIEIDAKHEKGSILVEDIELLGLNIDIAKMQEFVDKRFESRLKSLGCYIKAFNTYISSADFTAKNENMSYKLISPHEVSTDMIISWRQEKDNYPNPKPFLSKWDMVYYVLENFVNPSEDVEKIKKRDRLYSSRFKDEYDFCFKEKEEKPSFFEAIDAVKKVGGLAVLAHPGTSRGYKNGMFKEWELDEKDWFSESQDKYTPYLFVKELVSKGLDGVESYYYKGSDILHGPAQDVINKYFVKMAEKLSIMVTYGSDCHGPKGNGPMMGLFGSESVYI
ncbi:PHP domain-containing protein [Candidatus Woesearchaeota archaeon]|nr:PHP domain-containing protein [Candidatus Woesearchaeota archaeon]